MNISKTKLAIKFLFCGGVGAVVDYLLDILNEALSSIDDAKKEKIEDVFTISVKVLDWMESISKWIPTRWLDEYVSTLIAVRSVVGALSDFKITKEEIDTVRENFSKAVAEWKAE